MFIPRSFGVVCIGKYVFYLCCNFFIKEIVCLYSIQLHYIIGNSLAQINGVSQFIVHLIIL